MLNRKIGFFMIFLLLVGVSLSQTVNRWEQYFLSPLEIIHPGEKAISNPPFIHWQNVPGEKEYIVKIKGGDFYKEWTSTQNFYTPEELLPQGTYTLEISVKGEGEKKHPSSVKQFQISDNIPSFKARLNHLTFDKGKAFYPSRGVLDHIKKDGDRSAEYWRKLLDYARGPVPEGIKDLKEPPFYRDGKWNIDQWREKNSACYKVKNYVLPQCLAFRITEDRTFLENAVKILLPVSEWDPLGSTSVYESDHAAQTLLYSLSVSYNLIHDSLAQEQREKILNCIRVRTEDMYGFLNPFIPKVLSPGLMNDADNNHSWFCAQGLGFGALALMGDDTRAEEWLSYAAQLFYGLYLPRGGRSGEWHEGIDYWSYTLYFVFQFCDGLKAATDVDFYQHPWLQKTAFFKIYTHPPRGGYVPFGDSKSRPPNDFDKLVMMRLASMYGDRLAWEYVDAVSVDFNAGYLLDAVLWSIGRDPSEKGKMENPPFAYHYEDSGWVVSNNHIFDPAKRILFAFRCGRLYGNGAHSHADQNHFIIDAGGDALICDPGYYDYYGSPHHKEFTRITRAHNTILVDGRGQNILTQGADGKIISFSVGDKSMFVQGDASNPHIYGGAVKKFLRSIRYENEKDFTIEDDIETTGPAQISWLLHSAFPIKFDDKDNSIAIRGNRYLLHGQFKTTIPVEAFIAEGFPVNPEVPFTNPYHLELKTKDRLEKWKPGIVLQLSPLQ